ncbi:hypothetical protein DTZ01_21875, partial [Escherichia coli]|nr:hypothetical protein [Escherichia coli]
FSVITVDFRTGGILAVNGGFAVVVCRGVITINLGAGATVGDGALAFVIDDGLVTVDLDIHETLAEFVVGETFDFPGETSGAVWRVIIVWPEHH